MSDINDFTGSNVFWQTAAGQAKNDEARALHQRNAAEMEADQLRGQSAALKSQAQNSDIEAEDMAMLAYRLAKKAEALHAEREQLLALLNEPLHVIANKHAGFRQRYLEDRKNLASWMVSQKAYKELAFHYGNECGKTKEEIVEVAKSTGRMRVLNNETEFDNNACDSAIISPFIEELKKEIG